MNTDAPTSPGSGASDGPGDSESQVGKWQKSLNTIALVWRMLWNENIPRIVLLFCLLIFAAAVAVLIFEEYGAIEGRSIKTLGQAIYWAIITVTTVGYGDFAPTSSASRVATAFFVFSGMGLVSVLTATISAVLTAKRIREEKGLSKTKVFRHVVLCGWNTNAEKILAALATSERWRTKPFVLINDLPEEQMNEVLFQFNHLDVQFVRGNFVQETVLRRANIEEAELAIIVAEVGDESLGKADERTILSTLAIKSIEPDVTVVAELLNEENEQHLRRAEVDDVIISAQFSGYLMAAAAISPGIPVAVKELLTQTQGNTFQTADIPESLIGKSFHDIMDYFRSFHGAIAVGLVTQEPGMNLEGILNDELGDIDDFIRQVFSDAGKDISEGDTGKLQVSINPADDVIAGEHDRAIVIAAHEVVTA